MFYKAQVKEFEEELVVWREVLLNSYSKDLLWLEIIQHKLQVKIKAVEEEKAYREQASRGVLLG